MTHRLHALFTVLALGFWACSDEPAPEAGEPTPSDYSALNLNLLHGLFCNEGDRCRFTDRLDLLFQHVEALGCPDIVALQEIAPILEDVEPALRERAETTCPFPYHLLILPTSLRVDEEVILSRYPALELEPIPLHGDFRRALFVRVDHPLGPLVLGTTHLASGGDQGGDPCGEDCPAICVEAGALTKRDCQTVQLAEAAEARRIEGAPVLVTGDFNFEPGEFGHRHLVQRGFLDVYLEAGGPECSPETGLGCTSGREDEILIDLESPERRVAERIDFIFAALPPGCAIDPIGDEDGDGRVTGHFPDAPNPFVEACGPSPAGICWPSDHNGVTIDLNCLAQSPPNGQ